MASSNRHWPSMFKSKPCNTTTATTTTPTSQWQNDLNHACLMSSCQRPSPYSSSSVPAACEERSPEPKPRWNPKPEQIRILEAIFNSGLVNPPRDEIRRIRAQLQEYGQVGDANVFYWFQNRKSRSKHKQKHLQNTKSSSSSSTSTSSSHVNQTTSALSLTAPSSSSSSSSEKSSPPKCTDKPFPPMGTTTGVSNLIDVSNSPTASVNQQLTYFQSNGSTSTGEFTPHDPFYFPVQQTGGNNNNTVFSSQGFCFSELTNVVQFPCTEQSIGVPCSGLLLGELMLNHGAALRKVEFEQSRNFLQEQLQLNYTTTTASTTINPTTTSLPSSVTAPISTTPTTPSSTINQIQGVGESDAMGPPAAAKSTVFINDVAIEISVGPLNVRQTFGDDVVLIYPSGQPVLTNEWGVTLHSLTPGAFYYLIPMNC